MIWIFKEGCLVLGQVKVDDKSNEITAIQSYFHGLI